MERRSNIMRWLALVSLFLVGSAHADDSIDNPAIDMPGYLRVAGEAAHHREDRRVSEDQFIRMSSEPGTIVLDARSREKYDELHVRGALHLDFSDIAVESLRRLIPDRNSRILIYCNNNFLNAERQFPTKIARASLNLSTFIALYSYGYRNVYELGPLLDVRTTKLELEGSAR
jgi:phage shock protein E